MTLPELLVVILIIGLVSVVALPTIIVALNTRQVSEAGRILQGALVGARDKAIHDGRPSGIRLLPDPTFNGISPTTGLLDPTLPLAYNRIVPIDLAPEYQEGMVSVYPTATYPNALLTVNGYAGCPCLVLEESVVSPVGAPNPPTSWFWNVRVGDKVQLNGAGQWYTVVGPVGVANPEGFVNIGQAGTALPTLNGPKPCEFLLLVNGRDDNGNGWADDGFDGVDNNSDGRVDEHLPGTTVTVGGVQAVADEWEQEQWIGGAVNGMVNVAYTIRRHPAPAANAREVSLPTSMVIDASTVFTTRERSRLPVDRSSGTVDIMVNPDGTAFYSSPYSSPSSFGMADAFYSFWLADRSDVATPIGTAAPLLPIAPPVGSATGYTGPPLKEGYSILTLNARSGNITVLENPAFDNPLAAANANRPYNPGLPFLPAMQGAR